MKSITTVFLVVLGFASVALSQDFPFQLTECSGLRDCYISKVSQGFIQGRIGNPFLEDVAVSGIDYLTSGEVVSPAVPDFGGAVLYVTSNIVSNIIGGEADVDFLGTAVRAVVPGVVQNDVFNLVERNSNPFVGSLAASVALEGANRIFGKGVESLALPMIPLFSSESISVELNGFNPEVKFQKEQDGNEFSLFASADLNNFLVERESLDWRVQADTTVSDFSSSITFSSNGGVFGVDFSAKLSF